MGWRAMRVPLLFDFHSKNPDMLYRFKSQATADVVMLEPNARQLLDVIGKTPGPQGIVTVDQIPAAVSALEAAIHRELESSKHNRDALAAEDHDEVAEREHVGLHQRATPFLDMLKRSHAEGRDVVWGV
jgi:hypothetical protein